MTSFGSYIRQRRHALELTMREACQRSGIPSSDWSKMERDVNAAPKDPATKAALVKTLGLDLSLGSIYGSLAEDSWEQYLMPVTDRDIDDHLPAFLTLTPEQEANLRPLIRESLTRNPNF